MSFTAKRRIVIALLIAISLWPLAHHGIVRARGLSPWKGFGWSMYCVPPRKVLAYVIDPGTAQQLPFSQLPPASQKALMGSYEQFGGKRAELGPWVQPNAFAAEVFRQFANQHAIDIYVEHRIVGRNSASVERELLERFRYERDTLGGAKLIDIEKLGLDGRPSPQ